MNIWLWAAAALLVCIIPCGIVCVRGKMMERFSGLQGAQILSVLVILTMAEGYGRVIYFDLALVMAVLSLAAALVFVRFLERWL